MRNKYVQLSLYDTYTDVLMKMENNKPKFIELLEEYIDFDTIIPYRFKNAYYGHYGFFGKFHPCFDTTKASRYETEYSVINAAEILKGTQRFLRIWKAARWTSDHKIQTAILQPYRNDVSFSGRNNRTDL